MPEIKNVLFPTDFSDFSERALPLAVAIATVHEATLHVFNGSVIFETRPNVQAKLKRVREKIKTESLPYDLAVVQAENRGFTTSADILDYAERECIDLIVMATHGREGFSRALFGSVADEVVRAASCPVLVTRKKWVHPGKGKSFKNVLVPIDFSEPSRRAYAYALGHTRRHATKFHLVHVIEQQFHPECYKTEKKDLNKVNPKIVANVQETLQDLASSHKWADVETYVRFGVPAKEIAELATEVDADLILSANRGLTGWGRVVLGSVTENLIRHAPCPVWVYRDGKNDAQNGP